MATAANPLVGECNFTKFIQFRKVEEKTKGQPTVWGISTFEKPDLDDEVCHYDTAKPVYEKWSADALRRTAKAGQKPSLGNIRLQHSLTVGGKATKVDFDDEAREIWLGSEPIDEAVHDQLKEGFYTGYSQGGNYAWRKCIVCDTELATKQRSNYCPTCKKTVVVLYGLASLAEVSYVDAPCTDEGFEYVKANGSRAIVKFQRKEGSMAKTKTVAGTSLPASSFAFVGDADNPSTWKLPIEFPGDEKKTKSHIRNALARFNQTKGIPADKKDEVKAKIVAAAKKHGIDTSAKAVAALAALPQFIADAVDKAAATRGFRKGLYSVGRLAEMLQVLAFLYQDSLYERDVEGDDSTVPEDIAEDLDSLIETFLAMAEEEARELQQVVDNTKTSTGDKTMTEQELQKQREDAEKLVKKSFASHFARKAMHHEKCEGCEAAKAEHHTAMAETHKALNAKFKSIHKADVGNDHPEAAVHEVIANQVEFHKAAATHHTNMAKAHSKHESAHKAMAAHYHKMSESADTEEHTKAVAAIKAETAAEPTATAPVAKAPTLQQDVDTAAAEARESTEYKAAIKAIAKEQVDKELEELRKGTLAPDGVRIVPADGKVGDVSKGATAVARDGKKQDEFELVGAGSRTATAGL